jgi:hypothetical protein
LRTVFADSSTFLSTFIVLLGVAHRGRCECRNCNYKSIQSSFVSVRIMYKYYFDNLKNKSWVYMHALLENN